MFAFESERLPHFHAGHVKRLISTIQYSFDKEWERGRGWVGGPVLELLPLAVVSGGQVQIRWAGLAWHWPNAKPNLPIGTICPVNIARNAKPSLPIENLPIKILPNHTNQTFS